MISSISGVTPPLQERPSPEKKRKDAEKKETLHFSDLVLSSPEKQPKIVDRPQSSGARRDLNALFQAPAAALSSKSWLDDSDEESTSPGKVDLDDSLLEKEVQLAKQSPVLQTRSRHASKVDLTKVADALSNGNLAKLQELLQKAKDPLEALKNAKEKANPTSHPLFDRLVDANRAIHAACHERPQVRLAPPSILKLQLAALNQLNKGSDTCYLPRESPKRDRAMITSGQSFFILSKDAGPKVMTGGMKKICNLLAVMNGGQRTSYDDYLAVSNQAGDDVTHEVAEREVAIMRREFKLAEQFNKDVFALVLHRNGFGKAKCRWIEERYHTDLRQFLQFGIKPDAKRLSEDSMRFILCQVAQQLGIIHAKGFVHNDVNGGNIVIKEMPHNTLKVKINDFGAAYNLTADFPREDVSGYGTSANTAPEYFGSAPMLPNPIEQGQAEDMYALGCLLYSMIYGVEIPWATVARKAVEKTPQEGTALDPAKLNGEALEEMVLEYQKISDKARQQTGFAKLLYTLCLACLDPNPQTRIKIQIFMTTLQNFMI